MTDGRGGKRVRLKGLKGNGPPRDCGSDSRRNPISPNTKNRLEGEKGTRKKGCGSGDLKTFERLLWEIQGTRWPEVGTYLDGVKRGRGLSRGGGSGDHTLEWEECLKLTDTSKNDVVGNIEREVSG